MSHRHSCDRCRQQKVRCLRDELPSPDQSLPPCARCVKAGVDCVYSFRKRARLSTEGSKDAKVDSSMSGFSQSLTDAFSRDEVIGSGFGDLTGPFPIVNGGAMSSFDGWDANLHLLPPISPLPLIPPPTDIARDRDVGTLSTDDDKDSIEALTSQLTALSQRAMYAMRTIARPDSTPLTVSSPQVDEAFEDTNNLIRIINDISAALDGDKGQAVVDVGLIFMALASHQHLLALFGGICNTINRCLDSIAAGHEQGLHDGLHDNKSSTVAQCVMVLQLLMHMINRLDRSLFRSRVGSEPSRQVTPVTPTAHIHPPFIEAKENGGSQGLPSIAQALVGSIPDEHVKLRSVIEELQRRIEFCEKL